MTPMPEERVAAIAAKHTRVVRMNPDGSYVSTGGMTPAMRDDMVAAIRDAEAPLRARVAELEAELNRVAPFLATHGACGYRLGKMALTPLGVAEKAAALGFDVALAGESVLFSERFTHDPDRQEPHDAAMETSMGVLERLEGAGLKAVDVESNHDTVWGRIVEDVTP